jgi:hypothetical protein
MYHQFKNTTILSNTAVQNILSLSMCCTSISKPSKFFGDTIMGKIQTELQRYLKNVKVKLSPRTMYSILLIFRTGRGGVKVQAPHILNSGTKIKSRIASIKDEVDTYKTNMNTTLNKIKAAY